MTLPRAQATPPNRRRLRVLQVITHLDMGGAETVAMGLIDALRSDMDFALFAVLRHPDMGAVGEEMAERLRSWRVPYRFGVGGRFKSGGVLVAAARLIHEIRRFRADIVHLHAEIPETTFAAARMLSGTARRVAMLRTVHNGVLWIDWNRLGGWVTGQLGNGEAIAVSRYAADADAASLTRRARPRPAIIYNGVARLDQVAAERAPGAFRLLFAGRLVHQKGADLLPAILAEAHRRTARRDVTVTIAGSGVMRDTVAQGLATGLDGWTLNLVPPIEELRRHLGEFDAVLMPSRYEGFGLLAVEALLAGVPVVTTDGPGLDEVIPVDYPARTAVDDIAALGAWVARIIDDPAPYRAMAQNFGDALAARFDPQVAADAYATRYRALAGAPA